MDPLIKELQEAISKPDTLIRVSFAFNLTKGGTTYGVQLLGPRKKKIGMFLVHSEDHPNTPAGALRSLADLLEVKD